VGESNRRKKSDPNYGKSESLKPSLLNYCNSTIAQETALIVLDFWTDAGGIIITPIELDKLKPNQQLARQIAHQSTILNLGIRRTHEQSLGALTLMDRHFRSEIGLNDFGHEHFIFNWLTTTEISRAHQHFAKSLKGKAVVYAVLKQLVKSCNRSHQFPCWFSGIPPEDKSENSYSDLIFIADKTKPDDKIQTFINSQNFS